MLWGHLAGRRGPHERFDIAAEVVIECGYNFGDVGKESMVVLYLLMNSRSSFMVLSNFQKLDGSGVR